MNVIRFLAKRRLNYFDCMYMPAAFWAADVAWYWTVIILVVGVLTSTALELKAKAA